MAPIATLLNFAIAGTSGYSLYHSQQCFPHLGKCQTQHKADEATAGNTVIAGATMGLISFLGALYRLLSAPAVTPAAQRGLLSLLWLPAVLCLAEFAVAGYIRSFWGDEKKVPLKTEDKVSAESVHVSHNMEVMRLCDDLGCLWAVAGLLVYFGY